MVITWGRVNPAAFCGVDCPLGAPGAVGADPMGWGGARRFLAEASAVLIFLDERYVIDFNEILYILVVS
jgi:hypothetical protein